jgi:long-chain acyl-CoA synthetase
MEMSPPETTVSYLFAQAEQQPQSPAIGYKEQGSWKHYSWEKYAQDVRKAAAALVHLGVGEKEVVCILGFNRYEWVVFDLAAMMVRTAPAGIYETSSASEVQYILNHSEAKVLLIDQVDQWNKIDSIREELPHLQKVVTMTVCDPIDDPLVVEWNDFLALGTESDQKEAEDRYNARDAEDLATLIYTSGTTGPPKGVMLSNENLAWTARQAVKSTQLGADDIGLSYLPLSHIAEQMFTIHGPIYGGWLVNFATDRLEVLDNLKEIHPSVFCAVPRVWEKFFDGVNSKLEHAPVHRKALMKWAIRTGQPVVEERMNDRPAGGFGFNLANKLIHKKVKDALGFSRLRLGFTAAAPIHVDILRFFAGLDIPIYEIYGQSEGSGPSTANLPGTVQLGTVGTSFPGCEVKLAEDGEILLKGPNVFLGYYKDEVTTASVLKDGWLHSGDLGEIDEKGFYRIIGRKKEIIVTSGGKNIAPVPIEEKLKLSPLVSQAVVVGDRRNYLTALITLDAGHLLQDKMGVDTDGVKPTELVALMEKNGQTLAGFASSEEIQDEIQKLVETVNGQMARVKNVRKWVILPRDLTIDDGELTPTLKLKRDTIYRNWESEIERMYAG